MRNLLLSFSIGITILVLLSGCQWMVLYYATNTLDEPCTIRMKFSDKNRLSYKKNVRYGNIIVKEVNGTTEGQLKDTLHLKIINDRVIELTLPAKSTAIIDGRSSVDGSLDSISFTTAQKTRSYSAKSYSKSQKVSGGVFSRFEQSCLYTIK